MSNVGYATLQIIPSAKGFGSALQGETAPAMTRAGRDGGRRFGSVWASASLAPMRAVGAAAVGLFAADQIGGFLRGAITGASDLAETTSKVQQIFGAATKEVQGFAADSSRNLLLTKGQALDAAATFGVFGRSAGLAGTDLSGFSTRMVALASDLSSFGNTTPEQAIEAIGAALRGESEPIRQYGVLLDDATLRARALSMGLISSTKTALTPANKVLAAQAEILAQTSVQQGDAARTSQGYANQVRILGKQVNDAKTALGTALLPVLTRGISALNTGLGPALDKVKQGFTAFQSGADGGGALGKTLGSVAGFAKSLAPVLQDVGQKIVSTLGPGFRSVADTLRTQFFPAFQRLLPVIQPIAAFLIRTLGSAVVGAIKGAFNVINGVLKAISGLFNVFSSAVKGDWRGLWNGVKQIISGAVQTVKGLIQVFWNSGILAVFRRGAAFLLGGLWKGLWNGLKSAAGAGLRFVRDLISRGLTAVLGLFRRVLSNALGVVRGIFTSIRNAVSGAITRAREAVSSGMSAIRNGISRALDTAAGAARKAFDRIRDSAGDAISRAVETVQGLPGKVKDAVSGAGSWLYSAGRDVIQGLINGIKDMAGAVVGAVGDVVGNAISAAKDKLGIHSPSRVFAEIGRFTTQGFALGVESEGGKARRAMERVVAPPAPPALRGGLTGAGAALAGQAPTPVRVPLILDGREIAEAVFEVGGRDYAYGRKEF